MKPKIESRKNLLLVIDLQIGFLKESERFKTNIINEILPSVNKLINSFKGDIAYVQFINKANSFFQKRLNWKRFTTKEDQNYLPELILKEPYFEFQHFGYTVYTSEMKTFIEKRNYDKIYLSGIFTDICILKTAMDLFDDEKNIYLIEDAIGTLHGKESHHQSLYSLKEAIGASFIIKSDIIF